MRAVLENESELHARIFRFPTSAIKYNDRKINYYDFLTAGENEDCNTALLRMVPQIDIPAIHGFIDETPYLTDLQRTFYKTYLSARFNLIIAPGYEQAMNQQQGFSSMQMM
jgi:hypothetical protein